MATYARERDRKCSREWHFGSFFSAFVIRRESKEDDPEVGRQGGAGPGWWIPLCSLEGAKVIAEALTNGRAGVRQRRLGDAFPLERAVSNLRSEHPVRQLSTETLLFHPQ